ncbi:hypothetical protein ACE1CI_17925 [Aerosakkonemataceae cyanobacterium BLCC-F50]|uniref:EAL domain-containing protein n=1 Tax=Floridaenema flaviceps BLCC-F50 TaxID=3153642 RepID=A0ABV4XTM9_9CYAN
MPISDLLLSAIKLDEIGFESAIAFDRVARKIKCDRILADL